MSQTISMSKTPMSGSPSEKIIIQIASFLNVNLRIFIHRFFPGQWTSSP